MMVHEKPYTLFKDSGYSWRVYLEIYFGGASFDDGRSAFNKAMLKVCISVEWYFVEAKGL